MSVQDRSRRRAAERRWIGSAACLLLACGADSAPPGGAAGCSECPPTVVQLDEPFRPADFSADLYGLRYRGNSGNRVDLHVLMYGAFEKPVLHFLRDALAALAPAGGVFVDIGANTGQHSLFMSLHAKRVHAFEPWEPVLVRFREMMAENGVENISIHPVGLGKAEAEIPFYEPAPENLGTGSFLRDFKKSNRPAGVMRIVPGDAALEAAESEPIDLMKIDVEGFEKPVLAGLRRTLERSRPVVVMEISIDPAQAALFGSQAELRESFPEGYEFRRFTREKVRRLTGDYRLLPADLDFRRKHQHNIVALPGEKAGAVPMTNEGDSAGD